MEYKKQSFYQNDAEQSVRGVEPPIPVGSSLQNCRVCQLRHTAKQVRKPCLHFYFRIKRLVCQVCTPAIVKKWLLQNFSFAAATFESCGSDDQEGAGGGGELNRAGGAARAKD